jgi:hypothetical protein
MSYQILENSYVPIENSYVPMDYPDVYEYVPEIPVQQPVRLSPRLPITLDGCDVEPCPDGTLLDKDQVIIWAKDTLQECIQEPKACIRLTQLILWLLDE